MNLGSFFRPSLVERRFEAGLEFEGRSYSFGQLDEASNRWANRLLRDGVKPGERIAVYLANSPELILTYLAAVKAGLIFVPVNILYREREIRHILDDAEPSAVVTSREFESFLPAQRETAGLLRYDAEDLPALIADEADEQPPFEISPDQATAIAYTSGTTGRSKGAVLTHRNFAANAENLIRAWRLTAQDRLLLPLPLFHVHGLGNGLHTWLRLGFRMRLLPRFRKETIAGELLNFRPTVFFGVPTMYGRLLDAAPAAARRIGEGMRLFVSGSAPLPAGTLERFRELYGHVILERYGMTETLMNLSNPYEGERRPGSMGRPLPGMEGRLAGPENGQETTPGQTGELWVRGPNVFPGYWRNQEATREAFTPDGFFRTGDLAERSADGYYTLRGRRTELIISGGFNIYPREVEEFLAAQPEVAEAAVAGEPDPARGEVPVAYVVPAPGRSLDANELARRCRENLASFKTPRRFVELNELPRNALGKVERRRLAAAGPA